MKKKKLKKRSSVGVCPNCLNNTFLNKSHILSNSLYKSSGLPDENNSCIYMNGYFQRLKNVQSGPYERLYCSECEGKFSLMYESDIHSKLLNRDFFRHIKSKIRKHEMYNEKIEYNKIDLKFFGIDFKKVKGYFLLNLLRAHDSRMFNVNIGENANKLRNMLFNENFGGDWMNRFPIMVFFDTSKITSFNIEIEGGIINQPIPLEIYNHNCILWSYYRFQVLYFLNDDLKLDEDPFEDNDWWKIFHCQDFDRMYLNGLSKITRGVTL